MYHITTVTWIIIVFGVITCLPLLFAQLFMLLNPHGVKTKEILIGKGEDWRDKSHFKSAYSFAISDWLIFFPIFILSIVGIFLNQPWGYLLLSVSGAIQLYINVFLWFFEKEYVYPSQGPLKYYTYYWGNFIYWGLASLLYGIFRINGIII
ncbi:MAG: hypothetical protein R3250_03385 [Melioribacteraceae bacterium]|nr:hypothetical protein [Melioribacteraceae bacterium]